MLKRQDKQTVLVCPPFECLISQQQMNGKRSANLNISESQHNKQIIKKHREYIEKLSTDNQNLISKIKQKNEQIKKLQSVTIDPSQINFKKLKQTGEYNTLNREVYSSVFVQEKKILCEQIERLKLVIKQYEYRLQKAQRNNLKMGSHLAEQIQFQEHAIQMSEVAVQTKTLLRQKWGQNVSAEIQDYLMKVQMQKQKFESKYNMLKKKYCKLKQRMKIPRYLDQIEIQQEQHQYFEVQTQTVDIQKQQMPATKNEQSNQIPRNHKSVQPSSININIKIEQNNRFSHSSITSQNEHNLSSQNQQKIMELTQLSQKLQNQNAALKKTMEQFKLQFSSYTARISNQNTLNCQTQKASQQANNQRRQMLYKKRNSIQSSFMQSIFFDQQQVYLNDKFITPSVPLQSLDVFNSLDIQKQKSLMIETMDRKIAVNKLQINPIFFVKQQYRAQTFMNDQRLFKEIQSLSKSNVTKILKQTQQRLNRWINYIQKQEIVDQNTIKGIQREIGCKKIIQYMLTLKDR